MLASSSPESTPLMDGAGALNCAPFLELRQHIRGKNAEAVASASL
jgi:hypothetical protein